MLVTIVICSSPPTLTSVNTPHRPKHTLPLVNPTRSLHRHGHGYWTPVISLPVSLHHGELSRIRIGRHGAASIPHRRTVPLRIPITLRIYRPPVLGRDPRLLGVTAMGSPGLRARRACPAERRACGLSHLETRLLAAYAGTHRGRLQADLAGNGVEVAQRAISMRVLLPATAIAGTGVGGRLGSSRRDRPNVGWWWGVRHGYVWWVATRGVGVAWQSRRREEVARVGRRKQAWGLHGHVGWCTARDDPFRRAWGGRP